MSAMTATAERPRTTPSTEARRTARARGVIAPAAGGLIAAVVLVIHAGVPSFWGDEAASVLSAQRSLPSLMRELSKVDAVHGLYYLGLHAWGGVFGFSEFATRVPSALAAALAVAGVIVLARALFGPLVGIVSGIALAVMPEFTRMAIEARSYEFGVALITWLTVALVHAVRSRSSIAPWIAYAVVAVVAIYLWVFLGLILIAHAVGLWALRADRRARCRWMWSVVGIGVASAPIAGLAFAQRGQVAFLARRDYTSVWNVLVDQWFGGLPVAILSWLLIAVGVAALLGSPGADRRRFALVAAWAAIPTALILAVTLTVTPLYNPRYLAFSMPAVAIAIALGIVVIVRALRKRRSLSIVVGAGLVLGLVATSAPHYLAQRGPFGKGGADFRQVADVLRAQSSAGDAVVFDRTVKPSQRPRVITHLYPEAAAHLDDVGLVTPNAERAGIWDTTRSVADEVAALDAHPTVWAVEVDGSGSPDLTELTQLGFAIVDRIPVHRTTIYRLEKETP